MYRLAAFEASNISGFKSGLGKKTFRLDLRPLLKKDIIVILGNNATGKSTFLSLIHPMHTPSDKKPKFVVEGKEGLLIHEYVGDDGTDIITKAVYTPKGDSHTAKLYFKIIRNGEETELNPNGNVSSYYALVNTYFGVNKEYIQFASYNDVVKGIVKMTDTERKLSVSTMVPNTNRFETAYNIINGKYRDLNNTLRNLSQKIIHIGDEDSLTRDLKRYDRDIKAYTKEREELIKETSKLEGQIETLTGGKAAKELNKEFQSTNDRLIGLTAVMLQQARELEDLCDRLYDGEVNRDNVIKVAEKIMAGRSRLEGKIRTAIDRIESDKSEITKVNSRIADVDNQLNDYRATLFSIQYQSVDEMESIRQGLLYRALNTTYSSHRGEFQDMTYDEANGFMSVLGAMMNMIDVALERYGHYVSMWFEDPSAPVFKSAGTTISRSEILLTHMQSDQEQSYQKIAEYNSHSNLRDILNKRPETCTDDSCPFIKRALEWNTISSKLDQEMATYQEIKDRIKCTEIILEDARLARDTAEYLTELKRMIDQREPLFKKYFELSASDIYRSLARDQVPTIFNLDKIKKITAILSEKALYEKIMQIDLPNIEKQIELSKSVEKNRELISRSIERLEMERESLEKRLERMSMSSQINDVMLESYRGKLEMLDRISQILTKYRGNLDEHEELDKWCAKVTDTVSTVTELSHKIEANSAEIDRLQRLIKEIVPPRDAIYYSLRQLHQLNLEKAVVDRDFLIIDLMRKLIGPGKGIWKEAIDIYMQDINAVANQLLLHMFNGNLSLNDFIIDDKRFIIPYTFNGNEGPDISYASSSQQTTISNAISLAIISKLLDRYGILTFDEVDKDLSPANKEIFVKILATQMRYIGIQQCFIITHNPSYYEPFDVGYVLFPGADLHDKDDCDYIEVK